MWNSKDQFDLLYFLESTKYDFIEELENRWVDLESFSWNDDDLYYYVCENGFKWNMAKFDKFIYAMISKLHSKEFSSAIADMKEQWYAENEKKIAKRIQSMDSTLNVIDKSLKAHISDEVQKINRAFTGHTHTLADIRWIGNLQDDLIRLWRKVNSMWSTYQIQMDCVISKIASAVTTDRVNEMLNSYYTKIETYTKSEIEQKIKNNPSRESPTWWRWWWVRIDDLNTVDYSTRSSSKITSYSTVLTANRTITLSWYDYIFTGSGWTTTINDKWNVLINIANGWNTEWFRVTQNDVTNNPRAVTIVNTGTWYSLKIDHNATWDWDAVNIVSAVTWAGTAVGINGYNTTLSTVKVVWYWAQTWWAVIAAIWNSASRTTPVITAQTYWWGYAFKAEIEVWSTATWLYIQHDPAGTYTGNWVLIDSYNTSWDIIKAKSNAIRTSDNMLLLWENNVSSSAVVGTIDNYGTGDSWVVKQAGVIKTRILANWNVIWIQIWATNWFVNTSTSNNSRIRLNTTWIAIDRNIADSSPVATITNLHASSTGDILQCINSATTVLTVSVAWKITLDWTLAGSTGNQTIDKPSWSVQFAWAATSLTVTNSLVTASSHIFCVVKTDDTTAQIKNVVPTSGSFTINMVAAVTGTTVVAFWVIN